jgi:hypothetical protein
VSPPPLRVDLIAQRGADGSAGPEEVMRAVFLGLSFEMLKAERWGSR